LQREKNQFANPVRNTIVTSIEKIFEAIINKVDLDINYPGLEEIIKLRAVQDFSPSESLSFLFYLKNIIRKELEKNNQIDAMGNEFFAFENEIDNLLALAFDIYTHCRNKIYEIRLREIKSQSKRAFELLERQSK
jgi:hypothetical protein